MARKLTVYRLCPCREAVEARAAVDPTGMACTMWGALFAESIAKAEAEVKRCREALVKLGVTP